MVTAIDIVPCVSEIMKTIHQPLHKTPIKGVSRIHAIESWNYLRVDKPKSDCTIIANTKDIKKTCPKYVYVALDTHLGTLQALS